MNLNKVEVPGQKATIILTAFPGRTAQDDFSIEEMQRVLDYLETQSCHFFISLVQDQEFEEFCRKSVFVEELIRRPFKWLHFPILDMGVPDKDILSKLDSFRPNFVNCFDINLLYNFCVSIIFKLLASSKLNSFFIYSY